VQILGERLVEAPPPRVFCKKSLDLLDSKWFDFFESDEESARVSNNGV
jgi:hypothetical protein